MADIDYLHNLIDQDNVAEEVDKDTLDEMARKVVDGVEADEESRADWIKEYDKWQELATQVTEKKSFPWDGAANIKYPLVSVASLQFHARAYPEIVNAQPVRAEVLGTDIDGKKTASANRISQHMSYQLNNEVENWQEDMDRLLVTLPISGVMFRKIYPCPTENKIKSEIVTPRELVVNYFARSLEDAPRVTHVQEFFHNEIVEMINGGLFRDVDLNPPNYPDQDHKSQTPDKIQPMNPPTTTNMDEVPHTVYECHTWWDLDDDGYKEPYIITVEKDACEVLRIVPRFNKESFVFTEDENLYKIRPFVHFQNYVFIPDPNSEIYGLGFGHLLGPTNEAINTVINQLVDAGTLANMQGGFISKGVRIKGGSTRFRPGEWKITHAAGEDLQKGIYPLPVKEPSNVLFQLLNLLIESGQNLSSVSDIMVGQNPGQNQPAQTTMSVMEQGQKVFTGIFKRIYRALTSEYYKMYKLNAGFIKATNSYEIANSGEIMKLMQQSGVQVASEGIVEQLYNADYRQENLVVKPSANPESVTDVQRMAKIEAMWPLVQAGTVNVQEFTRRFLEAQGHQDIDKLMQMPEPQPDPETQLKQAEFEHKKKLDWANFQLDAVKAQADSTRNRASAMQSLAQAEATGRKQSLDEFYAQLQAIQNRDDSISKRLDKLLQLSQDQRENQRVNLEAQDRVIQQQQAAQKTGGMNE